MATCGACGKRGVRKTTLATVIERGKLRGKRVGECCAKDGVLLVASRVAPVLVSGERREQREVLAPFVRNLQARVRARKVAPFPSTGSDHDDELLRAERVGYDSALVDVIALLQEGRT